MACVEAPLLTSVLSEVTAASRHYVDRLFHHDPQHVLQGVVDMKNAVIGNNKQKANLIVLGAVPRLLYLLQQKESSLELRTECAIVLGSLAMGTQNNIKSLLDCQAVPALLQGLLHPDLAFIKACLGCLRTILTSPVTSVELLYTTPEHQTFLFSNGAVPTIAPLLASPIYKVRIEALKCFAVLTYENPQVSLALVDVVVEGEGDLLPQVFVRMMRRDEPIEMQLTAAKCLTYMCRAGALRPDDVVIVLKTLPCLVRMCSKERLLEERVEGAETLAYLIEMDIELQRLASITDQLIPTLADYFKYPTPVSPIADIKRLDHDLKHSHELRQAAFKLYAALGANDEDIRKKVIETESMMDQIVTGLGDPILKVQLAAVRCLHSLSRSVQQLRTSFQDHAVWKPLMKLLQKVPDEVLMVASSTLCNLLLEFSPSKEPILESGAVDLLCDLTQSENAALRVNGVWALMNMAFQAEQKVKTDILQKLGSEQLLRLLSDSDITVMMKTLGLLRNLLSTKPHIDWIMSGHGKQIMQIVSLTLEGAQDPEVTEQTLCIVANIADGTLAKELIMSHTDVLQKMKFYLTHSNVKLQIAATLCVSNLAWHEEEGALERQARLRDLGFVEILQQLSQTGDPSLADKVKTALQQFP
uniref:Armadillo repeat-containing protein 8 n=1 Tax=Eptatretus burgeri TaxID=7764 RepID=A0A8C4Q631_EPTBU